MLVGLYEETDKPTNAIEFIKKCLGAPSDTDVEQLKAENDELKAKVQLLEKQMQDLHAELEQERANH